MPQELIVTFHGIGAPPAHVPKQEHPYWIAEAEFSKLINEIADAQRELGIRIIATFDDGNSSDLVVAGPLLAAHGISGIFFPCSGRLTRQGYSSPNDLRTLASRGFEIGSHGVDHVPWKGLSAETLRLEVAQSKAAIEDAIMQPVTAAALPFGAYDAASLRALREHGYQRVYSSDPGLSDSGSFFHRRWTYRNDLDFCIRDLVRISRSFRQRVVVGIKHFINARR